MISKDVPRLVKSENHHVVLTCMGVFIQISSKELLTLNLLSSLEYEC